MSDYSLRRIDLKSQLLTCEISRIEQSSREAAIDLKRQEQNNRSAEKSWIRFLQKTVATYKSAPQQLQAQVLSSHLKTLSQTKKLLVSRKGEEQILKNKLESLLKKSKSKDNQLSHIQSQKKIIVDLKAHKLEQNISDEFAAVKSSKLKSYISNKTISTIKVNESKDLESTKGYENVKKTINSEKEEIKDEIILTGQSADLYSLAETNQTFINPICERIDKDLLKHDEQSFNSDGSRHKWQSAKESLELITQQNETVKVSVLQTSEGDSVYIDYLLSPGRFLSVGAKQTSESKSKSVAINLNASNANDRAVLSANQADLLADLQKRGVSITELEVAPK